MNYQIFENTHLKDNIETGIKIIGQSKTYYFYVKSNLGTDMK